MALQQLLGLKVLVRWKLRFCLHLCLILSLVGYLGLPHTDLSVALTLKPGWTSAEYPVHRLLASPVQILFSWHSNIISETRRSVCRIFLNRFFARDERPASNISANFSPRNCRKKAFLFQVTHLHPRPLLQLLVDQPQRARMVRRLWTLVSHRRTRTRQPCLAWNDLHRVNPSQQPLRLHQRLLLLQHGRRADCDSS